MDKHLCVDFDGVIHSYMTPWKDATIIPDPPVEGAFQWLDDMVILGKYTINIYSSRSGQVGGIAAMKDWFREHSFAFLDYLEFPTTKPPAYLTIDDRAICFRGTFPSLQELDNSKPWFDKYKKVDK